MRLVDYAIPPTKCPGCGAEMDGHLACREGQSGPDDGSVSICVECSTIAIYTEVSGRLVLRYPTDEEMKSILADPHVTRAIATIRYLREMNHREGNL